MLQFEGGKTEDLNQMITRASTGNHSLHINRLCMLNFLKKHTHVLFTFCLKNFGEKVGGVTPDAQCYIPGCCFFFLRTLHHLFKNISYIKVPVYSILKIKEKYMQYTNDNFHFEFTIKIIIRQLSFSAYFTSRSLFGSCHVNKNGNMVTM